MKIACVQFEPKLGRFDDNIKRAAKLVKSTDADLVVLPELATSGYFFPSPDAAREAAEKPDDSSPSVSALAEAAREAEAETVVYGFVEDGGDVLYNSAAVVTPGGLKHVYRKIHLFNTERGVFAPGDRPFEVVDMGAYKLGVMVCFDWIFPESMRSLMLLGADVICHAANLVLPWCQEAMLTRSLENRVFTATANRIGTETQGDETLTFTGMSQVTNPLGARLVQAGADTEEIIVAEIDPLDARDKDVTERNNVITDRRPDMYRMEAD